MREILASDLSEAHWSQRSTSRLGELREEFPWVRSGSTALVNHSDDELRWWTFAGGVANTNLAHQLKRYGETLADDVSIRIEGNPLLEEVRGYLGSLRPEGIFPVPDPDAIQNLKFSEALSRALADEVFCSRFDNPTAMRRLLAEPIRIVTDPQQENQQS
jgi:ATP-dependent Lhr-like helicase